MDAHDWDARYAAEDSVWGGVPNRFVEEHLSTLTGGRALDLACGEGRNAVWLAGRGWEVTGVDFSPVAIDKARRLAAERGVAVEWLVADLAEWTPTPAAYDLVLCCYLQVPRSLRDAIWSRAAAAVAPGGTFFLVGHDLRNVTDGYGGPRAPAVCYSADEVTAAIGLRPELAGEVERRVESVDPPATAIDCLVVARRPA